MATLKDENLEEKAKVPLLDEVNELIEKERTLLELKLVEQKTETEEWRMKYKTLIEKISATNSSDKIDPEEKENEFEEKLKHFEAMADADEDFKNIKDSDYFIKFASVQDVNFMISNRKIPWILDLTGYHMDLNVFSKLSKVIFGPKSRFQEIKVPILRNTGLNDDFSNAISSIIRSNQTIAIDLSKNNLGDVAFIQMIDTLRDKRNTPQYLLLDNNMELATHVKEFQQIINVLSEDTWGLSISLKDFHSIIVTSSDLNKFATQKSNKKTSQNDFKEIVKNPLKAYEFLRSLNQKLSPSEKSRSLGGQKARSIPLKSDSKARNKASESIFGRNGLQSMSYFGLTQCHLSKKTISELAKTLSYLAPSLTDLDLSFSFIGYRGASMLSSILSKKSCQLIRINLLGNSLGDMGSTSIASSLKQNNTLTYLDLRSNDISDTGIKNFPMPLEHNSTLQILDLRYNRFSIRSIYEVKNVLLENGSVARLLVDEQKMEEDGLLDAPIVFFSAPIKQKVVHSYSSIMKLFSIDWTNINLNFPQFYGDPVLLQWEWRPIPLNHQNNLIKTLNPGKGFKSNTNFDGYFLLGGARLVAHYEIFVSFNGQELQSFKVELDDSAILPRSPFVNSEWINGHVILNHLPIRGDIEVRISLKEVHFGHFSEIENLSETGFAFEYKDILVSNFPQKKDFFVGGDLHQSSIEINSQISKDTFNNVEISDGPWLHDFEVLRSFRWSLSKPSLKISFQAKLKLISHANNNQIFDSYKRELASGLPNYDSVGYQWKVYSISATGKNIEISSSLVQNNVRSLQSDNFETQSTEELSNPKEEDSHPLVQEDSKSIGNAWSWKKFELNVAPVAAGDTLLLVGKPISTLSTLSTNSLKKCKVICKDFQVFSLEDDIDRLRELSSREISSEFGIQPFPTNLYSIYNDDSSHITI